jgi:hypothetical protein
MRTRISAIGAVLLAFAGAAGSLLLPVYDVHRTYTTEGFVNVTEHFRMAAKDTPNRIPVLPLGGVVVLLAVVAAAAKKLQIAMGVCVAVLSVISLMSFGMFYVPVALALLYPSFRGRETRHSTGQA